MTARHLGLSALLLTLAVPARADDLSRVRNVDLQPLAQQARRVAQALEFLGAPLPEADRKALQAAADDRDHARAVDAIQALLDQRCLAAVHIPAGPRGAGQQRLRVEPGPARPELAEQGWRV